MDKRELDILIDKSVLGTITAEEQSKLDQYIMEKPNTVSEIQMRKDILKGLEYNTDQELKSVLDKIHEETINTQKKGGQFKSILLLPLSIAVMIAGFILYKSLMSTSTFHPEEGRAIYATYYQPFTASTETRDVDPELNISIKQFLDLYNSKEYKEALEIIQPQLSDADNDIILLAGISAMELDKTEEANSFLQTIIDRNDFYLIDHAKWYKSLLLLKNDEAENAKVLLQELAADTEADHHEEAKQILKDL